MKPFSAAHQESAPADPAPPDAPGGRALHFNWDSLYAPALGALLLFALFLRMANLANVQDFNGDQGRDYLVVMNWVQRGAWPLLGPDRAAVGDHALGPGWFYTVAPAMALSGFHPVAGAATVAALSVLAILLMADWVRRASGSRAAALTLAAVMALAALWTDKSRTLWNPHVLPLGVAGLAWLIQGMARRPVPCLAGALALLAILPQWHTTGLLVDAAAAPCLALAAWAAWPEARRARPASWALWGGALLAVGLLLYVPPLIYELKPGPGNIASYFAKAAIPAQPFPGGLSWRALLAYDRLLGMTSYLAFLITPVEYVGLRLAAGGAVAAAFLALYGGLLRRRQVDFANGYLALLGAGFWLVVFVKGQSVQDYYLIPVEAALPMLAGWTAGRLLRAPGAAGARVRLRPLLGTALLLGAGALSLAQAPRAWGIHGGAIHYGYSFKVAREVAGRIAQDADGRPFSVELAEPYNFPAHYFYLLRWMGRAPLNEDYYAHAIAREQMGERIFIIVGPGMPAPALKGGLEPGVLADEVMVRNVGIYRIDPKALPPGTRALRLSFEGPEWALEAVR